jgi:hypothetical protein
MSTLPIEIARYDRLTKNGLDCDYVTGRFTRKPEFHIQIYFEDEPNEYTQLVASFRRHRNASH